MVSVGTGTMQSIPVQKVGISISFCFWLSLCISLTPLTKRRFFRCSLFFSSLLNFSCRFFCSWFFSSWFFSSWFFSYRFFSCRFFSCRFFCGWFHSYWCNCSYVGSGISTRNESSVYISTASIGESGKCMCIHSRGSMVYCWGCMVAIGATDMGCIAPG